MANYQLSPPLFSPEISIGSPGPSLGFDVNPFELQYLEAHERQSQQGPGVRAPPPAAAFSLSWGNHEPRYTPLPPTNPYRRVPRRKPIDSVSSRSLESLGSQASGRSLSISDSQYLLARRLGEGLGSTGGIHWWTPVSMIGLFILGLLGAITHHLYYKSLHGREAVDQIKKVRIGTAMAVFTKATLVGCVVVAYRQRVWWTFRKKAMTLSAIDSMFAVIDDPTMFYEKDMVTNAKLATLMAVAVWLIPLAAVLSPASLATNVVFVTKSTMCLSIPSLNFSAESNINYRIPVKLNGYNRFSLSYFNTTDSAAAEPGWFDYWDQPSKNAVRLASMSRNLGGPVARENAAHDFCGDGWNCTYSISFTGPGYKCTELTSGVNSNTVASAPFDTSSLAPVGNKTYLAVVDLGDYINPQAPTKDGVLIEKPPPQDLGVFKAEPVIWVGYTVNTTERYPAGSPYAKWGNVMIPKIYACEHYETNYTVFFNFTGGQQFTNITERKFLTPIVNTSLALFPNGTANLSSIVPTSHFIRPNTDVQRYKLTAAYHSLGSLIRPTLGGTVEWSLTEGISFTHSDASDTKLFDQHMITPVPDLPNQIQSFYEDLILTLLSYPYLVIATNASVPCTKTRLTNQFHYHTGGLWPGYAIVIAISFAFLLVGLISMHRNGVDSNMSFSRIMATTRNRTLDRMCVGACLGSGPLSKEFREARLKFGELEEEDGEGEGGLGIME